MADAAISDALPGAVGRHGRRRAREPRCHRGDSADDQGRDRRARAPSGPARPVAARRRGDGRRHLRGRAVVHPPVAGGPRDDGRRSRHSQGPLRAAADPADVVPRPLAVRPAAVANHERPQHDSPLHVVRHGVPAAQHHPDHRGHGDPAGHVLAAGCRGAAVDRPDHIDRVALPAGVHPAVAAGAGPVRPRRDPRRGIRAGPARGEVVRPGGLRLRAVRYASHKPLRHAGQPGVGVGEVLDPAGGHPQPHPDRGARFRRLRGRPRLRHDGHAGCVHHDDAVAGVAHRVAGLSAVDDPGVVHRRQPDRRNL